MDAKALQYDEATSPHFTSTRNACKLCAPLGASIVFRGIEGCIPLIHGSQGCSTYIRRYVISHFKEPIDIASSNFSEQSAIFGGGDNLKKALDNLTRQYGPAAIGIASTCLSETIGDDVGLYISEYRKSKNEVLPVIIHASTPSYRGTHMEGFHEAVRAAVETLAKGGPRSDKLNVIPGFLSPEDLRYLKEILTDFSIGYTLLPDYSETLDGESWEDYHKLSAGGTTVQSIRDMGRAFATVQLGRGLALQKTAPAAYLQEKFGVPARAIGIPIGIRETDLFFSTLKELTSRKIPQKCEKERGRLVDAYIDGHKYVSGKRAVIYGEADFVAAMASFLDEIGVVPAVCVTGASSGRFKETVMAGIENSHEDLLVFEDTDFVSMLEACGDARADIVIGSSKGYSLSRKLGVPLVRAGFPIHDRIGGQRILHVGYRGTQQLFDRIVNGLIETRQDSSSVGYSYI